MKNVYFCLILIIVFTSMKLSAATVSNLSTTNVQDGSILTITGSAFSSNNLDFEWLGGSDGVIESGVVGNKVEIPNWNNSTFYWNARFDKTNSYSGNRSIIFDSTVKNDGRFHFSYDPGHTIDFGYVSWMAYIDTGGAEGQWKMFRMNHEKNIQDTAPEIVIFNWFGMTGMTLMRRYSEDIGQRYYPQNQPRSGEWVRVEMLIKASSTPGKNNSSLTINIHRPGKSISQVLNKDSLISYKTGETRKWRYFVFQNYQGNGLAGSSKVWMDDVYIAETKARVEIGNNSNWSDCTQREIQIPTNWNDNTIKVKVNQGAMPDGTAWLFVVDSNGDVSSGRKITFGESSSPTLPSAPTNLEIQ